MTNPKSAIQNPQSLYYPSPFTLHRLRSTRGQGTTEMIFLIPLFVILAAGAISITYMCWQGLKVQEAANLAARMAGQETVAGAKDNATIQRDNGLLSSLNTETQGDPDPEQSCTGITDPIAKEGCLKDLKPIPSSQGTGVYWRYRETVRSLFNKGEQNALYVPPQEVHDYVSQVKVARVMQPPTVFGWKMPRVTVESTAYGTEDSFMYGLPKFGHSNSTGADNRPFWQRALSDLATGHPDVKSDKTGE